MCTAKSSPALLGQITGKFVAEVKAFAQRQGIPLFHFERNEPKDQRAKQLRRERPVRDAVVFIGIAQEKAYAFSWRSAKLLVASTPPARTEPHPTVPPRPTGPKKHAKAGAFAYFIESSKIPSRTMHKLGTGVITSTQDVDRLEFDWGKIHFLSEPAVTGAIRFSFGIVELAAGKGHARHNHPGSEEIIYVMSGEGEQMVDDQPPVRVGPGSSIYIPADVYHSTLNTGTETMRLAVVYSPAGPERLLREIPGCTVVSS